MMMCDIIARYWLLAGLLPLLCSPAPCLVIMESPSAVLRQACLPWGRGSSAARCGRQWPKAPGCVRRPPSLLACARVHRAARMTAPRHSRPRCPGCTAAVGGGATPRPQRAQGVVERRGIGLQALALGCRHWAAACRPGGRAGWEEGSEGTCCCARAAPPCCCAAQWLASTGRVGRRARCKAQIVAPRLPNQPAEPHTPAAPLRATTSPWAAPQPKLAHGAACAARAACAHARLPSSSHPAAGTAAHWPRRAAAEGSPSKTHCALALEFCAVL